MAKLFVSGIVFGANLTQTFFSNGRDPSKVRSYNAIPIFAQEADFDQQAEITEVYHLLFGSEHIPAEVGNLQVNVTVHNKSGPYLFFQIWEQES